MDRDRATRESFDVVTIHLPGGRAEKCPALSIEEAMRYTSPPTGEGQDLLDEVGRLVREFAERMGLGDERAADLGFAIEWDERPVELGDLTAHDLLGLCEIFEVAAADAFALKSSLAKVRVLTKFPSAFGLGDLPATDVFGFARLLRETLYEHIYGLLRDFCSALTASPPVREMTLRARVRTSTLASTT